MFRSDEIRRQGLKPDYKHYITDVCVPLSVLPDMVYDTLADFEKHGLYGTSLGHAGDGELPSFADGRS